MKNLLSLLFSTLLVASLPAQTATDPSRVPIAKTVTLAVTADGTQPFSYQWFKDGVALPAANGAELVLANFSEANGGLYHCVVSNEAGSTRAVGSGRIGSNITNTAQSSGTYIDVAHFVQNSTATARLIPWEVTP